MHAGGALRRGGRQDQPAHGGRPGQRDLLGDEAADGEPEQVNLAEIHGLDEGDGVVCHLLHGARGGTGGAPDSGIVEGDDAAAGGQRVDQGRIPVVEIPAEVHEQDQRHAAATGVAVGVVDSVLGPDQLVRKLRVRGPAIAG